MEKTPKLPRKSLSLTTRLRSRSSASPGNRINSLIPSSPISPIAGLDCTPPHRKYIINPPCSPTTDFEFSPRSILSHSSTNSPEVTWRWTQDYSTEDSSLLPEMAKPSPKISHVQEFRKKRSVARKEELRKAELEKRIANKTKRNIALKKQCEQMELLIPKKSNVFVPTKSEESPAVPYEDSPWNSSGYGSTSNIDNAIDLLNDSESDGLLLAASQIVEVTIEKGKNNCTKELQQSFVENHVKDKRPVCEYLHDSLDDWFASLDADLLAVQPKKPRNSLQRYKSMPTDSPGSTQSSDTSKIKRYPSSSTLTPKSSLLQNKIFTLVKEKLKENRVKVRLGQIACFRRCGRFDSICFA